MAPHCTICSASNARACSGCHSACYCSRRCQKVDWPSHRLLCADFGGSPQRPGPDYKRAILFPEAQIRPQIVWIEFQPELEGYIPVGEKALLGNHFGPDEPVLQTIPIGRNLMRNRDLADMLSLTCRDDFLNDGSIQNQSVLASTQGPTGHDWRGPLIATKSRGIDLQTCFFMDVELSDFRDLIDYFASYGNDRMHESASGNDPETMVNTVKGVQINCSGCLTKSGANKYTEVMIPIGDTIFSQPVAPMSRPVGLPLHVRKLALDHRWHSFENQAVTFLHLETDPKMITWQHDPTKCTWGWAPFIWQNDVGNVLVVRQDKRDVTRHQVEALCHFCHFKMQPLFGQYLEQEGDPERSLSYYSTILTKEQVMGHMTPEKYKEFFEEFKARKVLEDPSWATAAAGNLA